MKYQQELEGEQEILEGLANLMIEIYAMESALLRTKKTLEKETAEKAQHQVHMTSVYIHEALSRIDLTARESLAAISEGDMLMTQLSILKKLVRFQPKNLIPVKREIADRIIKQGKFVAL